MEWRGSQHSLRGGLGEGAERHPPGTRQGTPEGALGQASPWALQATFPLRRQHGPPLHSPRNMGCGSGIEGRGGGKD